MTIYTLSSFLVFVTNFSVAVLILIKGSKNRITLTCVWFLFSVCFWGLGPVLSAFYNNYSQSLIIWQYANLTNIWAPITHHHFTLAICDLKKRYQLILLYTIGIIVSYINFFHPQYYLGDIAMYFDGFYFPRFSLDKNPLYLIYYIVMYWGLLLYSFSLLYQKSKTAEKHKKNQLHFLMTGSAIAWVGAHGDFPAAFGFHIYPFSNFLISIFPIFIGLGIIRYQFLDIKIAIKKSIVYSILLGLLSIIYLISVVIIENYLQSSLGYSSKIINILMIFLIGLVFVPLKNYIQDVVDKYFFKATPIELAEQNELLRTEVAETEKFKAIATLASGIAHEVKNPLTTLKTFIDYLPSKHTDPEFLAKFSRLGRQEIERVNNLVHNLLDFAKPSPPEFKEVKIESLIQETLNLVENQANKQNITLSYHLPLNTYHSLNIDPHQIKQALLNIFLNAIEAMPDTGTLTIETSLTEDKKYYQIKIIDTGSGVEPKDLPRIFEPFYTKKKSGTGLGLAVTYGIIEKHQGKVEVESRVGVGTMFKIKLPVK